MSHKVECPVAIYKTLGRDYSERGELIQRSTGRILVPNLAKIKLNFIEFSANHEP
jgi:hypothetical protein